MDEVFTDVPIAVPALLRSSREASPGCHARSTSVQWLDVGRYSLSIKIRPWAVTGRAVGISSPNQTSALMKSERIMNQNMVNTKAGSVYPLGRALGPTAHQCVWIDSSLFQALECVRLGVADPGELGFGNQVWIGRKEFVTAAGGGVSNVCLSPHLPVSQTRLYHFGPHCQ